MLINKLVSEINSFNSTYDTVHVPINAHVLINTHTFFSSDEPPFSRLISYFTKTCFCTIQVSINTYRVLDFLTSIEISQLQIGFRQYLNSAPLENLVLSVCVRDSDRIRQLIIVSDV